MPTGNLSADLLDLAGDESQSDQKGRNILSNGPRKN